MRNTAYRILSLSLLIAFTTFGCRTTEPNESTPFDSTQATTPCSDDIEERSLSASGKEQLIIRGEILKAEGDKNGWIICPRVAPDFKANCRFQIVTDDTLSSDDAKKLVELEMTARTQNKMLVAKVKANVWRAATPNIGYFIEDASISGIKVVGRCGTGEAKRKVE